MQRILMYVFLIVIVSCESQKEQYLFDLQFNGDHWVAKSTLTFTLFFDGEATRAIPIVYGEKKILKDSIESFTLMIFLYNANSLPDTIPFNTQYPATLIHNIRHISEPLSNAGIRSKSGSVVLKVLEANNNNTFEHLEGTFNAILADSSIITSGKFNAR